MSGKDATKASLVGAGAAPATSTTTTGVAEGALIGAYRMCKQIGAGGMGEVWLAEHTLLGRRAAIKLLHATYSSQPDIVARFFNEARAATAIADPGIVQIFDFGHDHGVAYIVMEMLDGETLEARRHRGISVSDALRILRQVASSLGAAHAHGIIHRDLKPENIFLVRDPEVAGGERAKILDFGIAKLTGDSTVKTQTSAVMGTPTFMSPEQCRGAGHVDQRSDIYSLGCVLFTILAGRAVFVADGVGELIVKHITEAPPRLSSFVAVPPALDELVARCLDKDPARRPGSGMALAALLGGLLADTQMLMGRGVATPAWGASGAADPAVASWVAGAPAAPAVPTTLSGSNGAIPTPPSTPRRGRGRGIAVGAAVAAVVVCVVAVAGIRASQETHSQPNATEGHAAAAVAPPPPHVDERPARATTQIRDVLVAFSAWAATHAGAPCPSIDELSKDAIDPWGHRWVITCNGQPEGQQIGVISLGPDGQLRTKDDLTSWQLDAELVAGARWVTGPAAPPVSAPVAVVTTPPQPVASKSPAPFGGTKTTHRPEPTAPNTRTTEPVPAKTDKPVAKSAEPITQKPAKRIELDEDGMPKSR